MKEDSILIIDPVGIKAGMDYYDSNLAEALAANGIRTFIASNFEKSDKCLKYFNSEKKTTKAGKLQDLLKGFAKSVSFARREKIKYVLVHIFSTEAKDLLSIYMLKAAKLKLITIAHDISGFANTDSFWIKNLIFNKYSNIILVHNNYSNNALRRIVEKETADRINVIPHGSFINLSIPHINKADARRCLNIPKEQKVILFFGQIKKVKGLDILLNALPMVNKEVSLIIAGKPWKDDFETYENLIEKHALQNRIKLFIRYIQDEERELFFKAADLLIIPYRNIYQSGVLLMGMSYNLPVLASDLEANKEVIIHGVNGLLFIDGDSIDLAEKINYFFSETENRQRITVNAFQILQEKHNWNSIALQYKQIFDENRNNRI